MNSVKLHTDTLSFLTELKTINNKEWFDANRERYELIRKQFLLIVDTLIQELSKHYPPLVGTTSKECVFRINRDIRFSKNKEPYKNHLAAFMAPGGRKSTKPGFYFHIEPLGQSYIGGGVYKPHSTVLHSIRQEIDYNSDAFLKIVRANKFVKEFDGLFEDRLHTVPKGYDKTNEMIEWLKYKSYFAGTSLSDELVSSQKFVTKCMDKYKAVLPLMRFLSACDY